MSPVDIRFDGMHPTAAVALEAAQRHTSTELVAASEAGPSCMLSEARHQSELSRPALTTAEAAQGFAFVTYASPEHARAAMERLNGVELPQDLGQHLKVWPNLILQH